MIKKTVLLKDLAQGGAVDGKEIPLHARLWTPDVFNAKYSILIKRTFEKK